MSFISRWQDNLPRLGEFGIHNYSRGVLVGYFELDKLASRGDVRAREDSIEYRHRGKWRELYLRPGFPDDLVRDSKTLIYSPSSTPFRGSSRLTEVVYSRQELLDPESYPNAKRRHRLRNWPINRLEEGQVRFEYVDPRLVHGAEELHRAWVQFKTGGGDYSLSKVHNNTFPSARYWSLIGRLLESSFVERSEIVFQTVFIDDKHVANTRLPFAVRVFTIENGQAFLLTSISRYWDDPRGNWSTATSFLGNVDSSLGDVLHINTGLPVGKGLDQWKHYWPYRNLEYRSVEAGVTK